MVRYYGPSAFTLMAFTCVYCDSMDGIKLFYISAGCCIWVVLFFAGVSYTVLAYTLIRLHGNNSALPTALGRDQKGKISIRIYFIAIILYNVNAG